MVRKTWSSKAVLVDKDRSDERVFEDTFNTYEHIDDIIMELIEIHSHRKNELKSITIKEVK